MTLIKWQKGTPGLNRNVLPGMESLFNDFFDGIVTNDFKRWNAPAVNISENEKEYKLMVAAPGLKKEDFKLKVDENILTISASKNQEKTETTEQYSRQEFSFNSFSRSFTLNDSINVENISANYEDGVMTILLPKLEVSKPKTREITIQ